MSDHLDRLEEWVKYCSGGGGTNPYSSPGNPTAPLLGEGVAALITECRQLRKDVAALEGILSDVREDGPFAAGEKHGAARQLAECVQLLREMAAAGRAVGWLTLGPPNAAQRL